MSSCQENLVESLEENPEDTWWAGDALYNVLGILKSSLTGSPCGLALDTSTGATAPCQDEDNCLRKGGRAALEVAGRLSPASLGKSGVPSGLKGAKMPNGRRRELLSLGGPLGWLPRVSFLGGHREAEKQAHCQAL